MKYKINLDGRVYEVEVESAEPMSISEYNTFAPAPAPVYTAPVPEEAAPAAPSIAAPAVTGNGEPVNAPMPGTIIKICVTNGQTVKKGDILIVLEAMKMENEITSPKDGTVTQLIAQKGANVNTGTPLVVIG